MRRCRFRWLGVIGLFAGSVFVAPHWATASSVSETVSVPFTSGETGVSTANSYTGQVTVTVSGIGQAAGTSYSDAFYVYTNATGEPITPYHPPQANFTLWINDQPSDQFVTPIPAYNPSHSYTFTITAPGGRLSFGVGDLAISDNTGAYTIAVQGSVDLSHRYVLFVDGFGSASSPPGGLSTDFKDIQRALTSLGISQNHFVYYSYRAALFPVSSLYCLGWDNGKECIPGSHDLSNLSAIPTYQKADTIDTTVSAQQNVLGWLLGQIVKKDPQATIDIIGYSLGGVITSFWGATTSPSSSLGGHIHRLIVLESPVGGIPGAAQAFQNCSPLQDGYVACLLVQIGLKNFFGSNVLTELQLPATASGSIVGTLPRAAQNFPFTSIQSTTDYVVNDVGFPMRISVSRLQYSFSVPIGIGAQYWSGLPSTFHVFQFQPENSTLAPTNPPLDPRVAFQFVLNNHGIPLHDKQMSQLVTAAVGG